MSGEYLERRIRTYYSYSQKRSYKKLSIALPRVARPLPLPIDYRPFRTLTACKSYLHYEIQLILTIRPVDTSSRMAQSVNQELTTNSSLCAEDITNTFSYKHLARSNGLLRLLLIHSSFWQWTWFSLRRISLHDITPTLTLEI